MRAFDPVSPVRAAVLVVLLAGLSACGGPWVHKVVVQQGNVISQGMIDKLKPGMTRSQVAFIMGEPVVRNTFNSNRWDYVYTIENPGIYENQVHLSLFFVNDGLSHFTGDLAPTSALEAERAALEAQAGGEADGKAGGG